MKSYPNKIPATVRVFTCNSEKVIRRCLESLTDFAEIYVLDGNSTDQTLEIVREFGARIEQQYPGTTEPTPIRNWPELVNRAMRQAKYDWVLYIDSDEQASPGLVAEIREIVSNPNPPHRIWRLASRTIYEGREIKYCTTYPGYQFRFLNRTTGAQYDRSPHYQLFFDKERYQYGTLRHPWYIFLDSSEPLLEKWQVIQDALSGKNQSWSSFFRFAIQNKLWGAAKIFVKVTLLYMRYGFHDTLPPRIEYQRVLTKLVIMQYMIRQKIFREDLTKLFPKEIGV